MTLVIGQQKACRFARFKGFASSAAFLQSTKVKTLNRTTDGALWSPDDELERLCRAEAGQREEEEEQEEETRERGRTV